MKDQLDRIEAKVGGLDDRLDKVDITLAAQHVSLKEHMRRTSILENDIKPIKKHVQRVHGALAFLGLLSVIAGLILTIKQIIG